MAERLPFGASAPNMNDNILYHALDRPRAPRPAPPFPLVSSASFGSARSRPGREAAKRTLDGEDRSGIIQGEGKGGAAVEGIGEAGLSAPLLGGCSEPSRRDK